MVVIDRPLDNSLEENARKLILEPSRLKEEIANVERTLVSEKGQPYLGECSQGISVVVPVYKANSTIKRLLVSLTTQTVTQELYELILVVNGEDDGTVDFIESFVQERPEINLRFVRLLKASAGRARNVGIQLASKQFITFVDADDEVGPRFFENLLGCSKEDTVVVAPIVNLLDGEISEPNLLLDRIRKLENSRTPLLSIPWLLSFNACKAFSTALAKKMKYKPDLQSGEDIVFFSELLKTEPILSVEVPSVDEDASYYRHITKNSVSRREESFEFNVIQRLEVVAALNDLRILLSVEANKALVNLEQAQFGFIKRYLENHPDEASRVEDELAKHRITNFPWSDVNRGKAKDLVFSYCFSPFSDTSAAVAAKAVAEREKIVDVISNSMHPVRRIDPDISALADRWIDSRVMIQTRPSFAGWEPISEFGMKALEEAELLSALKGGYETVYSRALWIGSHVAGALYKLRHPNVNWSAEFSDPLRTDAEGNLRKGDFKANYVSERLLKTIRAQKGFQEVPIDSIFQLVEAATFILADELIFTNANQLEYMLKEYSDDAKKIVLAKATVRHHPVPPKAAYLVKPTSYNVDSLNVNIAFFGSFYANRGLNEVLIAISNLPNSMRRLVRLHIFCNKVDETKKLVSMMGLSANIYVNPYLSYLEFLNASQIFDVLLVNDVVAPEGMSLNPFLPSKFSDYLGSGRPLWGLVDKNSPLSKLELQYVSEAGNGADIFGTLKTIIEEETKK